MDQDEMTEMAEAMLDCACGHGLGSHNGAGCYASLGANVRCACLLTDDRTYPEMLVQNLSAMFERLAVLEQEASDMDNTLAETQTESAKRLGTIARLEALYKDWQSLPYYVEERTGFHILDGVDRDELLGELRRAIDGTSRSTTPTRRMSPRATRATRATRKK